MNKGKVELKSFARTDESCSYEYLVEHTNWETTLDQILTIHRADDSFDPHWIAEIKLDEFPPQKTPAHAAQKMAEWLERLAAAIRIGDYMSLPDAKFQDLDDQPDCSDGNKNDAIHD